MQKKFLKTLTFIVLGALLSISESKTLPSCAELETQCLTKIKDCLKSIHDSCVKNTCKALKLDSESCVQKMCQDPNSKKCKAFNSVISVCEKGFWVRGACGGWTFENEVCGIFGQTQHGAKTPYDCQKFWRQNEKPEDLCKHSAEKSKLYNECQ